GHYQGIDASNDGWREIVGRELSEIRQKPRCFISYSHMDSAFAFRLAKDLRSAGIKVWIDENDLNIGRSWDKEIEVAINKCNVLLFVASSRSVKSPNVADEISFALN